MTASTYRFLYVSRLVDGQSAGVVPQIMKRSRQHNLGRGIRGALIFDGLRFAQLLEGAETEVRPLAVRILRDPRHERILSLIHI